MGLIARIFRGKEQAREANGPGGPASSQLHESEPSSGDEQSRNAPRRELVQVVLRDTMRKHGIPSDWIESRILSTFSRSGRPGLHANFVVKRAHDQMLGYVFAFQHSFERELARFEPRARDWLLSIAWEFQDFKVHELPGPGTFAASEPPPLAEPEAASFVTTEDLDEEKQAKNDEDVERDLKALFAIRDAALAEAAGQPRRPEHADFQPTQPFKDSGKDS